MTEPISLDPEDWSELRALGHRMLDDMIDYIADVRERPVWQPTPPELRAELRSPLPDSPCGLTEAYADFQAPREAVRDRQCASALHGLGAWRGVIRSACSPTAGRGA